MKNSLWTKATAGVLVFLFVFTDLGHAMPALDLAASLRSETPQVSHVQVPPELATLDDWYEARAPGDTRLMLHIQDAHAQPEAQARTRDLIQYFNKEYGITTVFVEGAAEELDTKWAPYPENPQKREQWVEEKKRSGEISGADLALLGNIPGLRALPIETVEGYRRGYQNLRSVFESQAQVADFFHFFNSKLDLAASRVLNEKTRSILTEWEKFENGHRDFLPFVKNLAALAKQDLNLDFEALYTQIDWPQITRLLVLQRVEESLEVKTNDAPGITLKQKGKLEKQAILDILRQKKSDAGLIAGLERLDEQYLNLNRITIGDGGQFSSPRLLVERLVAEAQRLKLNLSSYPAFLKYAGYLILRGELKSSDLYAELEKLFEILLQKQIQAQAENAGELVEIFKDRNLLEKLLHLELSRDEWQLSMARREKITPQMLMTRLKSIQEETASAQESSAETPLEDVLRRAYEFYDSAIAREQIFFEKISAEFAKNDKAILVTGGFHTEGINEFFREKDISYGTLTPRINRLESGDLYRRAVQSMADPASAAQALVDPLQSPGVRTQMVGGMIEGVVRSEGREGQSDHLAMVRLWMSPRQEWLFNAFRNLKIDEPAGAAVWIGPESISNNLNILRALNFGASPESMDSVPREFPHSQSWLTDISKKMLHAVQQRFPKVNQIFIMGPEWDGDDQSQKVALDETQGFYRGLIQSPPQKLIDRKPRLALIMALFDPNYISQILGTTSVAEIEKFYANAAEGLFELLDTNGAALVSNGPEHNVYFSAFLSAFATGFHVYPGEAGSFLLIRKDRDRAKRSEMREFDDAVTFIKAAMQEVEGDNRQELDDFLRIISRQNRDAVVDEMKRVVAGNSPAKKIIYVLNHHNPDFDAMVSALLEAYHQWVRLTRVEGVPAEQILIAPTFYHALAKGKYEQQLLADLFGLSQNDLLIFHDDQDSESTFRKYFEYFSGLHGQPHQASRPEVILVDHNTSQFISNDAKLEESDQVLPWLREYITEVVDHHPMDNPWPGVIYRDRFVAGSTAMITAHRIFSAMAGQYSINLSGNQKSIHPNIGNENELIVDYLPLPIIFLAALATLVDTDNFKSASANVDGHDQVLNHVLGESLGKMPGLPHSLERILFSFLSQQVLAIPASNLNGAMESVLFADHKIETVRGKKIIFGSLDVADENVVRNWDEGWQLMIEQFGRDGVPTRSGGRERGDILVLRVAPWLGESNPRLYIYSHEPGLAKKLAERTLHYISIASPEAVSAHIHPGRQMELDGQSNLVYLDLPRWDQRKDLSGPGKPFTKAVNDEVLAREDALTINKSPLNGGFITMGWMVSIGALFTAVALVPALGVWPLIASITAVAALVPLAAGYFELKMLFHKAESKNLISGLQKSIQKVTDASLTASIIAGLAGLGLGIAFMAWYPWIGLAIAESGVLTYAAYVAFRVIRGKLSTKPVQIKNDTDSPRTRVSLPSQSRSEMREAIEQKLAVAFGPDYGVTRAESMPVIPAEAVRFNNKPGRFLYIYGTTAVKEIQLNSDPEEVLPEVLELIQEAINMARLQKREIGNVPVVMDMGYDESRNIVWLRMQGIAGAEDLSGNKWKNADFYLKTAYLKEFALLFWQMHQGGSSGSEYEILHRDIKPENILWNPLTGQWQVNDFGISGKRNEPVGHVTEDYLAPEISATMEIGEGGEMLMSTQQPWSPAADVYSFGRMLIAFFSKMYSDDFETVAFFDQVPEPVREKLRLLIQATQKENPIERPSMEQVAEALQEIHQSRSETRSPPDSKPFDVFEEGKQFVDFIRRSSVFTDDAAAGLALSEYLNGYLMIQKPLRDLTGGAAWVRDELKEFSSNYPEGEKYARGTKLESNLISVAIAVLSLSEKEKRSEIRTPRRNFIGVAVGGLLGLFAGMSWGQDTVRPWRDGERLYGLGSWGVFAGGYKDTDAQQMFYRGKSLSEVKITFDTRRGHAPQAISINANGAIRAHAVKAGRDDGMASTFYLMRYHDEKSVLHDSAVISQVFGIRNQNGKLILDVELADRKDRGVSHWKPTRAQITIHPPDRIDGTLRMDIEAEAPRGLTLSTEKEPFFESFMPYFLASNHSGADANFGGKSYWDATRAVYFDAEGNPVLEKDLESTRGEVPDSGFRMMTAEGGAWEPRPVRKVAAFAVVNDDKSPAHVLRNMPTPPTVLVVPHSGEYFAGGAVTLNSSTDHNADNLNVTAQPSDLAEAISQPLKVSVFFMPGASEKAVQRIPELIQSARSENRFVKDVAEQRPDLLSRSEMRISKEALADFIKSLRSYTQALQDTDLLSDYLPDLFLLAGNPNFKVFERFVEVYKRDWLNKKIPILVTGGIGRGTPDMRTRVQNLYPDDAEIQNFDSDTPEAEILKAFLVRNQIPAEMILTEGASPNTEANYRNSKEKIESLFANKATRGKPNIFIVTDPPLMRRAKLTADRVFNERIINWNVRGMDLGSGVLPDFDALEEAVQNGGLSLEQVNELVQLAGYIAGFHKTRGDGLASPVEMPGMLDGVPAEEISRFGETKGIRDNIEKHPRLLNAEKLKRYQELLPVQEAGNAVNRALFAVYQSALAQGYSFSHIAEKRSAYFYETLYTKIMTRLDLSERQELLNLTPQVLEFLSTGLIYQMNDDLSSESAVNNAKEIQWNELESLQDSELPNIVILFGSRDDQIPEMAAATLQKLLQRNPNLTIITSGRWSETHKDLTGQFYDESGVRIAEAEHFKRILVKMGIPEEKILAESKSGNTGQNIRFSRQLIGRDTSRKMNILAVAQPGHQRRVGVSLLKQWLSDAETNEGGYSVQVISATPKRALHVPANVVAWYQQAEIAAGEVERLQKYPAEGYTVPVQIPQNIMDAATRLRELIYKVDFSRSEMRAWDSVDKASFLEGVRKLSPQAQNKVSRLNELQWNEIFSARSESDLIQVLLRNGIGLSKSKLRRWIQDNFQFEGPHAQDAQSDLSYSNTEVKISSVADYTGYMNFAQNLTRRKIVFQAVFGGGDSKFLNPTGFKPVQRNGLWRASLLTKESQAETGYEINWWTLQNVQSSGPLYVVGQFIFKGETIGYALVLLEQSRPGQPKRANMRFQIFEEFRGRGHANGLKIIFSNFFQSAKVGEIIMPIDPNNIDEQSEAFRDQFVKLGFKWDSEKKLLIYDLRSVRSEMRNVWDQQEYLTEQLTSFELPHDLSYAVDRNNEWKVSASFLLDPLNAGNTSRIEVGPEGWSVMLNPQEVTGDARLGMEWSPRDGLRFEVNQNTAVGNYRVMERPELVGINPLLDWSYDADEKVLTLVFDETAREFLPDFSVDPFSVGAVPGWLTWKIEFQSRSESRDAEEAGEIQSIPQTVSFQSAYDELIKRIQLLEPQQAAAVIAHFFADESVGPSQASVLLIALVSQLGWNETLALANELRTNPAYAAVIEIFNETAIVLDEISSEELHDEVFFNQTVDAVVLALTLNPQMQFRFVTRGGQNESVRYAQLLDRVEARVQGVKIQNQVLYQAGSVDSLRAFVKSVSRSRLPMAVSLSEDVGAQVGIAEKIKRIHRSYQADNRRMGVITAGLLAMDTSEQISDFFKEGVEFVLSDERLGRFSLRSELRKMFEAVQAFATAA